MKNFCFFMKKTANQYTPFLVAAILVCGLVNILARYMCGLLYDTIGTEKGIFYRNAVIILCPCLIILTWLRYVYSQRYLTQVEQDLSRGLEEAVTAMPLRELENSPKGYLLNLRENDISKVSSFLKRFYERFLNSVILYLLSLILLAVIHPSLALAACVCSAAIWVVMKAGQKPLAEAVRKYQQALDRLQGAEAAGIYNLELLKISRMEGQTISRHDEMIRETNQARKRPALLESMISMPSLLGAILTLAVLTLIAGVLQSRGVIQGGAVLVVVTLTNYIVDPVMMLDGVMSAWQRAKVSYGRISEACAISQTGEEGDDLEPVSSLCFENVSFGYQENMILSNLNVEFHRGRINIIRGVNGSGKSTLLKLMKHLYDNYEGAVYINGRDIRDIPASMLGKSIAVCTQDIYLYNTSILENLTLDSTRSKEDIEMVCEITGIAEEIRAMPEGYDTLIYNNGAPLSVGQCQRLMLARTLLSGAGAMIFDEPTSAFDPRTTGRFTDYLKEIAEEKLIIVITHDADLFDGECLLKLG